MWGVHDVDDPIFFVFAYNCITPYVPTAFPSSARRHDDVPQFRKFSYHPARLALKYGVHAGGQGRDLTKVGDSDSSDSIGEASSESFRTTVV